MSASIVWQRDTGAYIKINMNNIFDINRRLARLTILTLDMNMYVRMYTHIHTARVARVGRSPRAPARVPDRSGAIWCQTRTGWIEFEPVQGMRCGVVVAVLVVVGTSESILSFVEATHAGFVHCLRAVPVRSVAVSVHVYMCIGKQETPYRKVCEYVCALHTVSRAEHVFSAHMLNA